MELEFEATSVKSIVTGREEVMLITLNLDYKQLVALKLELERAIDFAVKLRLIS